MTSDDFSSRGQALEEMFFHKKNQELLEKLKAELESKQARQQLSSVSGITDEAVLDSLVTAGIRAETLACLSLIPLVAVAWADGKLDTAERQAVMRAVKEKGLPGNPIAVELVEHWLEAAPGPELLNSWEQYVKSLSATLESSQLSVLKADVMSRAIEVARSAGGFLGIVNPISRSEQLVIDRLEAAFA